MASIPIADVGATPRLVTSKCGCMPPGDTDNASSRLS
jgi:hypothetical protein